MLECIFEGDQNYRKGSLCARGTGKPIKAASTKAGGGGVQLAHKLIGDVHGSSADLRI